MIKFLNWPIHLQAGPRARNWAVGMGCAVALLVASGCGGGQITRDQPSEEPDAGHQSPGDIVEADVDEDLPDPDLYDYAMSVSRGVCEKIFECCTQQERVDDLGMSGDGSVEQCADQSGFLGFVFGYGQLDDSIKAGRIKVDADMIDLCMDGIEQTSCERFSSVTAVDDFIPGCRDVFLPQVDAGGDCQVDQDCKTGTCAYDEGVDAAICQELPTDGAPCPRLLCADGLYCETFTYEEPTCVGQRPDGESCADNSQCQSNYCGKDEDNARVCKPKSAVCQGS